MSSPDAEERGTPARSRRVVISSITGEPLRWDDDEDASEPVTGDSNDSRLAGDVPPHWGTDR